MKIKILIFLLLVSFFKTNAQYNDYDEDEYEEVYLEPINDKSDEGQKIFVEELLDLAGYIFCLLYTSPSPRDATLSRMPSSA